ncbi:glycosyltransferase [Massilia sp. CF038]|uniref:glycosyltransferase family 2 protein n=1 Tax=Massilia sp. CF038 TaxID=1881045 RepID=UPI00091E1EA9|nr:glycosyltransferase [Massilia sp. CF038]SHH11890.1 Glycosyl transferase family 2 [Massilia sp. CF038]
MATFDVLLPVKDGIAFLPAALDSIVAQTFRDWRLIVLDHGSTDGSTELAQSYAARDARIVVRSFPEARGLSGLLNAGLELCDCKYVLRQDADDVSLPERMAVLAAAFEANPDLVVAGSLGDVIDAAGKTIGQIDMPTGRDGIAAGALFRTPVCHPAAAMRLDALQRLGQRSGRAVRYGDDFIGVLPAARQLQVPGLAEDYFLFGQLALVAPCVNLDRKLIQYRWHGGNVGATKHQAQMQMALDISRSLAETAALMHQVARVDPAPFCNHGERLFEIEGESDFADGYLQLEALMRKMAPAGPDLERELAFRRVLARRERAGMALRFAAFAAQHGARSAEKRTVRSWLLRGLQKQAILRLAPSGRIQ